VGPTCLFDKSFLQSLSIDESVWFDHFFLTNICPLYLVETLADLSKQHRDGRDPLHEVAMIAAKTPEMHSAPSVFHLALCEQSIYGRSVPMTGQIPLAGGRPVKQEGKPGVVFEPAPEARALQRWQQHAFYEVEHQYARHWRISLAGIDLKTVADTLRKRGIDVRTYKSLGQARDMAQAFLASTTRPFEPFEMGLSLILASKELREAALRRWRDKGCPPLNIYAPYVAHVLAVELFFQFAVSAGHIGAGRSSNIIDIQYLHYLPFCQAFVSSDTLHRRCAPLFLRQDQAFIWGPELKADLARVNEHYLQLAEAERERGITAFASAPPDDNSFLVRRIWDQLLTRRVVHQDRPPQAYDRALVDYIQGFMQAPELPRQQVDFDPAQADVVGVQRQVHRHKGSWWQVPKDA
jgi:hypothetical protein